KVLVRQLDVRVEESVVGFFKAAEDGLGAVDILVNNAGEGADEKNVAATSIDDFDRVVKTNLNGPFLCSREFIRRRQAAGGKGKIINITSVHEKIPSPGYASYGAAKGGLLTLTRSLALELAPLRINVNAIAPGLIRTPMTAGRTEDPAKMKEATAEHPLEPAGRAVGDCSIG